MTIIASCGHTLTDKEGEDGLGWPIVVKDFTRNGELATAHLTVCKACFEMYKSEGITGE